jgi:hypothetical protein
MRIAEALLLSLLAVAGCAAPDAPAAPDPRLLQVAKDYVAYGRVNDRLAWAPTRCQAPIPQPPRLSASRDPETHGRKLYHLYAKHFDAYRMSGELPQPVGQVLVKEAWVPAAHSTPMHPVAGARAPLFVMMKTGEADSDAGWIYATMTPDGKTVTAAGKIASCMECHESKQDRLFGVTSCAGAQ